MPNLLLSLLFITSWNCFDRSVWVFRSISGKINFLIIVYNIIASEGNGKVYTASYENDVHMHVQTYASWKTFSRLAKAKGRKAEESEMYRTAVIQFFWCKCHYICLKIFWCLRFAEMIIQSMKFLTRDKLDPIIFTVFLGVLLQNYLALHSIDACSVETYKWGVDNIFISLKCEKFDK